MCVVDEKEIKLKKIDKIIYPLDIEAPKGLRYKNKQMMSVDRMIEILKAINSNG